MPSDTAYITPEDARTLFQSQPDVMESIGVSEDMIGEAEASERMIPVSMARVQTHTDRAAFDSVVSKLVPDPKHTLTPEQAKSIDLSSEAQKIAEETDKVRAETKAAYDEAITQLTSLGRSATEIRAASKLLSMAEYFGQHSDMTAAEWIRNVAFQKMTEEDFLKNIAGQSALNQSDIAALRPDTIRLTVEEQAAVTIQRTEVRSAYENTDLWMKAPNGESTNLTEDLWVTVRTPYFKAWFGDWEKSERPAAGPITEDNAPFTSVLTHARELRTGDIQYTSGSAKSQVGLLDENGEPLVVHHGTPHRFAHFMRGDIGFHFGTEEQAEARVTDYYDEETGKPVFVPGAGVYSGFLNLRNPLYIPDDFGSWVGQDFTQKLFEAWERGEINIELTQEDFSAFEKMKRSSDRESSRRDSFIVEWENASKGQQSTQTASTEESDGDAPYASAATNNISHFLRNVKLNQSGAANRGAFTPSKAMEKEESFSSAWNATVTLFEGAADASTLVHETGHYAFEMMRNLVRVGAADERMQSDFAKLQAWAEIDPAKAKEQYDKYATEFTPSAWGETPLGFAEWKDTAQKERLARGFEAYCMEGKAPSAVAAGSERPDERRPGIQCVERH